jgi:hypothetical protein
LIVLCNLFASLLFPLSPFLLTSPFLSLLFFISFLLTSLFLFSLNFSVSFLSLFILHVWSLREASWHPCFQLGSDLQHEKAYTSKTPSLSYFFFTFSRHSTSKVWVNLFKTIIRKKIYFDSNFAY